jgi:hypothetical protein
LSITLQSYVLWPEIEMGGGLEAVPKVVIVALEMVVVVVVTVLMLLLLMFLLMLLLMVLILALDCTRTVTGQVQIVAKA